MTLLVVRYALRSTYFPLESNSPTVVSPTRHPAQGENDMRALVARRLDGPDTLELIETPLPEPAAGQVRIKVAAAAVNPVDLAVSAGLAVQFGLTAPRDQFGLGWDVAGTV